ncbi:cyclic nucleotide-binding domain-containing protein [Candidatus Skiveiella danica]|uniref:cyclic nucleotide-binding domain-containing protein n=1 Tax=Candidatus Skiveiella danica TaxID=3386177 RepID=UPI0039B9C5D3
MSKDSPAQELGFLVDGRLQGVDFTVDGRSVGLYFVDPGDYFGELSVVDGQASFRICGGGRQVDGGFSGVADGTPIDSESPRSGARGNDATGASRALSHGPTHAARPAQPLSAAVRAAASIAQASCRREATTDHGRSGAHPPGAGDNDQHES